MKSLWTIIGLAGLVIVAMATGASAAETEGVPTFNTDVAPIIFNNCASCHRDGQVAPMSLTSYQETRPWARAIKEKVVSREMPPWHADLRYGRFKNIRTLSQAQIDTIVAWADGGAPEGTAAAPALPDFPEGWANLERPPDFVVEMPLEVNLPAEGEIPYFTVWAENPFGAEQFIEAVQFRPGNAAVVHHAGGYSRPLPAGTRLGEKRAYTNGPLIPAPVPINENETAEERRARAREQATDRGARGAELLLFYVPGGGFQQFPSGTAKRLDPDRYLSFSMHYNLTGKPETDRSALGFWLAPERPYHVVLTTSTTGRSRIVGGEELVSAGAAPDSERAPGPRVPVIPPNDGDWEITGIWALTDDVTLYGLWPHMHLRGKDMTYVITYPDGREEIVLHVPQYDFNWQMVYDFEEPLKVPAGSTIKTVAHFDNSIRNRYNPAPDNEVYWGEQSWDEMFMIFTKYSVDKDELSQDNPSTDE